MITIEKITVYDKYDGDIDNLLRNRRQLENDLFAGNNDWTLINNFYQDILLLNEGLASKVYADNSIITMRKYCDNESFQALMNKLY